MAIVQGTTNAATTVVTVTKVFGATHMTHATIFAMKGMVFLGQTQSANQAMIFTKLCTATNKVIAVTLL